MSKIKVGVLRGGISPEYDVSLMSGENVLESLSNIYEPLDILITKDGTWHMFGIPITPEEASRRVDVFFNALHGAFGEDGKIQHILDQFHVPYTGSRPFGSALGMNKILARNRFQDEGLKVPNGIIVRRGDNVGEIAFSIFNSMPPPWIIKPACLGSSVGVTFAKNYDGIINGLTIALSFDDVAIVEEFIKGKEATCCVVETDDGLHALPPIEIIPPDNSDIFSYDVKYNGKTRELCPGSFSKDESLLIAGKAKKAHNALNLRHYSRSDFIVSESRGIILLESNTLPGLTKESLIMKPLNNMGISFTDFLDHVISLALAKK